MTLCLYPTLDVTRVQTEATCECVGGTNARCMRCYQFLFWERWSPPCFMKHLQHLHCAPLSQPWWDGAPSGFPDMCLSTAYLAAHNCLQWGERNVRHVSLRNRVFIWKKKNHSTANGNVNLSALFLKINIYKEFPIWEEPKRPKIFLSMKSLTAGLSGKMLSSSAKRGENIPARFKD